MKTLLVIAMVSAVKASPQFVYTVGNTPLIYTNGHFLYGYNGPTEIEEPVQPTQYVRPLLYANNACRNNFGVLVPCAFPSSASASVYAYNNVPSIDFFQFTDGSAAPVETAAPVEPATPEADETDSVVSVKKREANPGYIPEGYYGGRGYYHAGAANIENTDYGTTDIKYLVKRDAEAKPQPSPYLPPSIKDINYGKSGIKYLKKREANPTFPSRHIPLFEMWAKMSNVM